MAYTFDQLQQLWIQAGGNPQASAIAAATALAESGGNPNAVSPAGDIGLWQINQSAHGSQATTDPLANARAAVAISNNGTNWRPWCTAYTDGACGTKGGAFDPLGSSPVGRALATGGVTGVIPAGVGAGGPDPSSGSGSGGGIGSDIASAVLSPLVTPFEHMFDVVMNHTLYVLIIGAGLGAMGVGLVLMLKEAPAGATIISAVGGAAKTVRGAVA